MDETAKHSRDLFTKDAHSCGRNLKKPFKKILIMNTFIYGSASPGWYYSKAHSWNITKELRIRVGKLKALSKSQNWPAGPWPDPPDILAMKLFFFS